MKKFLGTLVLGLLLSSNAYAASKFTYLSCPSIIWGNESKGKYKDSELYKIGSCVGHSFIKFKDTKKKWTPVTLYNQGNAIEPQDPDIWMRSPPIKLFKAKFLYDYGSYFFFLDDENINISWALNTDYDLSGDEIFVLLLHFKLDKKGIDFWSSSNYYVDAKKVFDNIDFCKELDKEEFNKLIKKGIE